MALYYDLKVFKDVYRLILKIFEYTQGFPREYKYTLGQDMKRDGITLVRSIYRANKARNKTEYLEQFLDDFEILKLELRLCTDMKILSIKKQAHLAALMDGIVPISKIPVVPFSPFARGFSCKTNKRGLRAWCMSRCWSSP